MNDFYKTIFMNYYKDIASPILSNDDYPFILKNKIKNINLSQLHKALIKDGYFVVSSINEVLNTMKVKELKKILESNGIKSTGRKNTNITKLGQLNELQIINCLPKNYKQYYSLSAKGHAYIKKNYDYVEIMKYYKFKIDVSIYNNFRTIDHSFFDGCEKMFISQLNSVSKLKTSYSKQVMYKSLAHLYELYGIYDKALYYALADLYVELSADSVTTILGFPGTDLSHPISLSSRKKQVLLEFDSYVSPQDDTIRIIHDNNKYFNYQMIDKIYKIPLTINLCSKKYFTELVISIFNDNFDKEKVINKIKKKFKWSMIRVNN